MSSTERAGMSLDRIRLITTFYGEMLKLNHPGLREQHIIDMVPRLHVLLDENRIEKAMRWLGFIQGTLETIGFFTLDELKEHSRPDGAIPTIEEWVEQLADVDIKNWLYAPKTTDQKMGYVVEECGEVLAAIGKAQRWGLESVNPELPVDDDPETNRAWILRELKDLKRAIDLLEHELKEQKVLR